MNRVLNKSIEPKYVQTPVKNYILGQLGDLTKIKKMLGFQPRYTLQQGIREVIDRELKASNPSNP